MATYSMNSVNKARQMQEAVAQVNASARERLSQMFIDLYMTPGAFADAQHRLGRAIALADEEETVSTRGFPPQEIAEVTHSDLPFRLGGFKTVNDQINHIQRLLRELYGEIRTKITEWDLSIYMQEYFMDPEIPVDLSDLSVLYRLKEDNPGNYRGHQAYIYGMLNAAISFDRWKRWDPRLDRELKYWEPPTSSLELWAYPPKKQWKRVTYTYRKKTRWWGRRRTFRKTRWVWYYPKKPRLNALQTREKDRALAAKWTNWFPPYWKLFFWDPDLNSLGAADEEAMKEAHLRNKESSWSSATKSAGGKFSLSRFKRAKKNRSSASSEASLAAANAASGKDGLLGKTARTSGLNLRSPLLIGGPVGRYKDPRSLAGYLSNEPNSWRTPKIAPTRSPSHSINRRNRGINQMEGLYRILYGWSTSFRARRTRPRVVRVWVRTDSHTYYSSRRRIKVYYNGRSYTRYEYGRYEKRTIQVPYWTNITRTGQFPNLTGNLQYLKPQKAKSRVRRRFLFWRFFATRVHYIPGKYVLLGDIVHNSSFRSRFVGTDRVPVIMVSADQKLTATVTIQRDSYQNLIKYYRRKRRWFRWRTYGPYWKKSKPIPCYTVHVGSTSQLTSGVRAGASAYDMAPTSLQGFVGGSVRLMRGFFFSIPARNLSDSDNVITSDWAEAGFDNKGATVARAFTTCVWRSNRGSIISSTFPHTISVLHTRLSRVSTYLRQLQALFADVDSRVMRALIDQLPYDKRKHRARQLARQRFSPKGVLRIRQHISSLLTVLSPLLEVTSEMRTEGGVTVGRVRAFIQNYARTSILTRDRFLYNMLDSYLMVLYEWRTIYIQQRLNKVDGTLLQLARIETIDIPTAEGTGVPPAVSDVLVDELLHVAHKTTNVSLAQRSEALRNKTRLPTERIHYVYVPVQYDENGNIIRHAAGNYDLISREYIEDEANIPRVRFFITFEGAQAPPIVNNIITGVNPTELQKIMSNPHLSVIEKICAARDTQDWWKIAIPSARRPLTENFETDIVLMMIPEDARVEGLMALLGEMRLSPILEHEGQEVSGSMAGLDETVKDFNSTALKGNK